MRTSFKIELAIAIKMNLKVFVRRIIFAQQLFFNTSKSRIGITVKMEEKAFTIYYNARYQF